MSDQANERIFQDDIIRQMVANGWVEGKPENYQRESALYTEDVLSFVKETQPKEWLKFCKTFPVDSDSNFINALVV